MSWILNIQGGLIEYTVAVLSLIFVPITMVLPVILTAICYRVIKSEWALLCLPIFWLSYEYLFGLSEFAYNWTNLGLGLSEYPSLIQAYDVTGIAGGGFIILTINVLVFLIFRSTSGKTKMSSGIVLCSLFSLILISGMDARLGKEIRNTSNKISVAIIQPNYNSYAKLTETSLDTQLKIITNLIDSVDSNEKVDLFVIPEGFLNGIGSRRIVINKLDSTYAVKYLKVIAQKKNAAILTGFIGNIVYPNKVEATATAVPIINGLYADSFNAAMLITPAGRTQYYAKYKLVPFMERVPYLSFFSGLENLRFSINQASSSYGKLENQSSFSYKDLNIIPVICLETIFPDYVRNYANTGGNLIVVLANETWVGDSFGYKQNTYYTSPLAISLNRSVVRAGNSGISTFIDKQGNMGQKIDWNEQGVLIGEVHLNKEKSFYSLYGDYFGRISVVLSLFVVFWLGYLKIKSK